jgi:hypothetical protein
MRSDPSKNAGADIDLGLFEDVLLGPGASPVPQVHQQSPSTSVSDETHATPEAAASEAKIVTVPADVRLLTFEQGEYSITIEGYSGGKSQFRPHPFAAVDVTLAPGLPANAVTVVSAGESPPPWPYDRDLILTVTVTANSATLSVIVFRPEGLASPTLHVKKLR